MIAWVYPAIDQYQACTPLTSVHWATSDVLHHACKPVGGTLAPIERRQVLHTAIGSCTSTWSLFYFTTGHTALSGRQRASLRRYWILEHCDSRRFRFSCMLWRVDLCNFFLLISRRWQINLHFLYAAIVNSFDCTGWHCSLCDICCSFKMAVGVHGSITIIYTTVVLWAWSDHWVERACIGELQDQTAAKRGVWTRRSLRYSTIHGPIIELQLVVLHAAT